MTNKFNVGDKVVMKPNPPQKDSYGVYCNPEMHFAGYVKVAKVTTVGDSYTIYRLEHLDWNYTEEMIELYEAGNTLEERIESMDRKLDLVLELLGACEYETG